MPWTHPGPCSGGGLEAIPKRMGWATWFGRFSWYKKKVEKKKKKKE